MAGWIRREPLLNNHTLQLARPEGCPSGLVFIEKVPSPATSLFLKFKIQSHGQVVTQLMCERKVPLACGL